MENSSDIPALPLELWSVILAHLRPSKARWQLATTCKGFLRHIEYADMLWRTRYKEMYLDHDDTGDLMVAKERGGWEALCTAPRHQVTIKLLSQNQFQVRIHPTICTVLELRAVARHVVLRHHPSFSEAHLLVNEERTVKFITNGRMLSSPTGMVLADEAKDLQSASPSFIVAIIARPRN